MTRALQALRIGAALAMAVGLAGPLAAQTGGMASPPTPAVPRSATSGPGAPGRIAGIAPDPQPAPAPARGYASGGYGGVPMIVGSDGWLYVRTIYGYQPVAPACAGQAGTYGYGAAPPPAPLDPPSYSTPSYPPPGGNPPVIAQQRPSGTPPTAPSRRAACWTTDVYGNVVVVHP